MSDPQRPLGKTPPRAPPLQPDRPGGGVAGPPGDDPSEANEGDGDAARQEQAKTAHDNVREGYGSR